MFSNSKNSVLSSKLGHLVVRSRTVVAAAVAVTTLGLTSSSFGAFQDITSIVQQFIPGGTPTTGPNVQGAGASYSAFQPTNTYKVVYDNKVDKDLGVYVGSTLYNATGQANSVVERNASNQSDNDTLSYLANSTTAVNGTVTVQGPQYSGYNAVFNTNNLLVGADNLFSNTGNAVGNNTNVDRLDVQFPKFAASTTTAFAVMDRGPTNDHDAFEIAAITAVDGLGNPTAYGPLHPVGEGTWGKTDLLGSQPEVTLRKNDSVAGSPFQPSDSMSQPIGGILIPSSSLVAAGTPIYGYSLFSGDVPTSDTSAQLVNYASLPTSDSTAAGGGLDAVATVGVLYTTAVPEPTTIALAGVATLGLLGRRPKKIVKA